MSITFMNSGDPKDLAREFRRLADALDRLADSGAPSAADLATAPMLDRWAPVHCVSTALEGVIHGHPSIADGSPAVTAQIMAINEEKGWARSLTGWFLLGSRDDGNRRGPAPPWRDEKGRVVKARNRGVLAVRRPPG